MSRLIITIGRQYGSGGKEIGKKLAKRLAIPFYGKEELMKLAKEKSGYEEVSCFYEEQPINSLLYAIAMNQEEGCRGKRAFDRIRKLCENQSCVLVGRCGNYVFKDDADCTSIFLYAQKSDKVNMVTKRDGVSPSKAEARIEKSSRRGRISISIIPEKPGEKQSIMTCALIQGCLESTKR